MIKKLAIITTHPIQYYAPVFQLLAKQIDIKVFYTAGDQSLKKYDVGFGKHIEWDIPLLDGYSFEFLENIAKDKGSHHFNGVINPSAIERIKIYNPDSLLIYGWSYHSHLKIMRYFNNKIPIYFRGDSTLLNAKRNWKYFLKKIFLKWVYTHIDTAFYVGTANKAYFKAYGLTEKQLVFAPHAIDNNRFAKPHRTEADRIRAELALSENDILVLFAGKLEPVKNPELLLKAFGELGQQKIHLLFVGNGILEEKLKIKVESQKIERIHFMDFQNQSQMPILYQACNLLCLPSKSETWGLAINEAMAAGKPVLVSNKVGCALDLVTNQTGAIFKSEDFTDLKQKLIDLTLNKEKLKIMGYNAKQHIKNWSFEQQVNAIVSYVS